MTWRRRGRSIASLSVIAVLFGCGTAGDERATDIDALIAQGEKVFASKKCGFCHEDQNMLASGTVPDLSRAVNANDSMLVQVHMQFADESRMPPIQVSATEIRQLSHYIAHLHALKHQTIPAAEADAKCPVCYVPVSSKIATENGLVYEIGGEKFYFECQDCMDTFKQAPEAFR